MSTSKEMQMPTKQFSNYESLITFTRASGGHALRPVSYGDELVTNGTFDTDLSGWTDDNSQWAVSGSRAYHASNNVFGTLRQSLSVTTGNVYKITFDYEVTQGELRCQARDSSNSPNNGSLNITDLTGTGSASVIFVPDADFDSIAFARDDIGVASEMYVDNVSVKEVFFDESDGTLTLFEHPENVPRVEWDSAGNRLGLLVEEARTNLISYSEDLSVWDKNNVSVGANTDASPDGAITADTVNFTLGLGAHIAKTQSSVVSSGDQIVASIHLKGISGQTARLVLGTGGGTYQAITEDLVFDGSWQRFSIGPLTLSDVKVFVGLYVDNQGGSKTVTSVAAWGGQIEQGAFPTSYIKTTGSTATRSADVASIPVADFGYNQSAGTFVSEFQAKASLGTIGNFMTVFAASDNTTSNRIRANSTQGLEVAVSGIAQANLSSSFTANFEHKYASAYKENDFAFSQDGGTASTDTSGTVPAVTQVEFGRFLTGRDMTGHIKSIKYYPRRLTNAQLQDLTS